MSSPADFGHVPGADGRCACIGRWNAIYSAAATEPCSCFKCSKSRADLADAYDRGYAAGAQHVAFSTYEENIEAAALDRSLAVGWATGEWRVVSCDYEENDAGRRATPMPAPALRPVDTARSVSGASEDHIERGRE